MTILIPNALWTDYETAERGRVRDGPVNSLILNSSLYSLKWFDWTVDLYFDCQTNQTFYIIFLFFHALHSVLFKNRCICCQNTNSTNFIFHRVLIPFNCKSLLISMPTRTHKAILVSPFSSSISWVHYLLGTCHCYTWSRPRGVRGPVLSSSTPPPHSLRVGWWWQWLSEPLWVVKSRKSNSFLITRNDDWMNWSLIYSSQSNMDTYV